MNIFENAGAFLGEIRLESLGNALTEFYGAVADVKGRLGHSGRLLDEYLELVFGAIHEVSTETSATDGYSSCMPELKRMCGSIVRGESGYENHPLYEQTKQYIDLHPLPHLERLHKIEVYAGVLMGDYSKYAIEKYYNKYNGRLADSGYISELNPLYNDICGILGSEDAMERLNMIIKRSFLITPVMHSFLQAVIDNMLEMLSFKVPETAKHVFELVPCMEGRDEN